MPDILLTNDDGYKSAGFFPLLKELSKDFSVVAVAPDEERSWIGKAITTKRTLRLNKVKLREFDVYTLNGTPADCVQIGLYNVLDSFPTMVVSGINQGLNIGHARILSSGTIGATMEASIEGVHALASSMRIPMEIKKTLDLFDEKNHSVFEQAAKITAKLTRILIKREFDDDVDLFSVNIPFDASIDSGIQITKPFKEPYGKLFYEKDGGYELVTPRIVFEKMQKQTDLKAISEGKISITPIHLDLFSKNSLKRVEHDLLNSW